MCFSFLALKFYSRAFGKWYRARFAKMWSNCLRGDRSQHDSGSIKLGIKIQIYSWRTKGICSREKVDMCGLQRDFVCPLKLQSRNTESSMVEPSMPYEQSKNSHGKWKPPTTGSRILPLFHSKSTSNPPLARTPFKDPESQGHAGRSWMWPVKVASQQSVNSGEQYKSILPGISINLGFVYRHVIELTSQLLQRCRQSYHRSGMEGGCQED